MSKLTDKVNSWATFVKSGLYLVGVIVMICGSVYLTIDRTFEAKVHQLNAQLDSRITVLEVYNADQIEKNILKQADKIQKGDTEDIKTADIEDALKYFPMLKDPSQRVIIAYEHIREWYKTHID